MPRSAGSLAGRVAACANSSVYKSAVSSILLQQRTAMVDPLHPDRIAYHRGSIVFGLLRGGTFKDLRQPLDVLNGKACGCVCDQCGGDLVAFANDPEKISRGFYQKIPHFAHAATNARCEVSGERGLAEAVRIVLASDRTLNLPKPSFKSPITCFPVPFGAPETVMVTSVELLPNNPLSIFLSWSPTPDDIEPFTTAFCPLRTRRVA